MNILNIVITLIVFLTPAISFAEEYQLSTHVLDTTLGKPGNGVELTLEKKNDKGVWFEVGKNTTNKDGRINSFLIKKENGGNNGVYRFTFELENYFAKRGDKTVFPQAVIVFRIEGDEHYHIPLVVTPFALSTYRGS